MAGATIITKGTYTSLVASAAVGSGNFSSLSASVDTLVTDGTEVRPLFDFMLDVTTTAHSADDKIELHRVPYVAAGSDAQTPTASHTPHVEKVFLLNNTANEYFVFGVENVDENDKFIVRNRSAASVTCQLYIRGRGWNTD